MKTYKEFINEGIKNKMTPKSEENIKEIFSKMTPIQKIEKGAENGIMWAVEEGLREIGKSEKSLKVAIQNAIQNNHLDITEYLIDNGNVNLKDIDDIENNINYMIDPDEEFEKSIIGKLNAKRLEILKGKNDYTGQLSYACQHNDYELAVESIEKGADVKDKHGMFMWKAVSTRNVKLIKLLLDKGVPPESSSEFDANQNIEKATGTNNVEIVKLLLQYGSKIISGEYAILNHKIIEWVEKGLNHEMIVFLLENYPSFYKVINKEISKLDAKLKLYQKYTK